MSRKKPIIQFPWTDFQAGNLDFLIEKYGEYDGRIKAVEDKNDEQDARLDEDDTLIANLRADLTTETNQRTTADNDLSDRITAEVAARIAGDSTLQTNLNTEATTRANADTTLQTNINNEATVRANADTALQNAITAEATARDNADTTLQNNINSEATTRANADNTLLENIQQEQQNRITMDQGLQAEINAIPVVKANDNTGTAGGDLTSLKVGNTSYTVPQGGQGTTVVANPSGSATAGNLTKLQVGTDIYNVPSGGTGVTPYYVKFNEYAPGAYQIFAGTDPANLTNINDMLSGGATEVFQTAVKNAMAVGPIVFIDTRGSQSVPPLPDSYAIPIVNTNGQDIVFDFGDYYINIEEVQSGTPGIDEYLIGLINKESTYQIFYGDGTSTGTGGVGDYIVDSDGNYAGFGDLTSNPENLLHIATDYYVLSYYNRQNNIFLIFKCVTFGGTNGYKTRDIVVQKDSSYSPYRYKIVSNKENEYLHT